MERRLPERQVRNAKFAKAHEGRAFQSYSRFSPDSRLSHSKRVEQESAQKASARWIYGLFLIPKPLY
jgi:hypothetical protein